MPNLSDSTKSKMRELAESFGYDTRHWTRPVMYENCHKLLNNIGLERLDALEISAGSYFRELPFKSFTEANYPEFDVCEGILDKQYDLIIADQVFEHLLWPYRAARNVHAMLKPGGYFLNATPFMIKLHPQPHDCTRWSETGMQHFLHEAGFPMSKTITGSWGNRACVKANLNRWSRAGWFGSMKNEPNFPVTVWALAQKPKEQELNEA